MVTASARIGRVVVLNDVSVVKGGATDLAMMSIVLLRQRGLPVTLITGDQGENALLSDLDVEVVAIGERRLIEAGRRASMIRGLYNSRALARVTAWITQNDRPDTVYHLHGFSQILSPSIFRALSAVSERLFITAHDFFLVCPNGAYALFGSGEACALSPLSRACILTHCDRRNYGHKLWRVARQGIQSRLLGYEHGHPRVLAIHGAMRPLLERGGIPGEAITTLPNPIRAWSVTRIPVEDNREIVFVGRLNDEKGADLAARAARRAGVPLRIIGDGPMLAALRRDFPEAIFSGRQPPAVVADLVRSARALVMPSRYPEPYGLVAGEALWSGLPVIVAEQALIAPSIVERGAGIACDPRDEAALASAMARLVGDDALAKRMSMNAFASTRDLGHTPDTWADALMGLYRDAIGAPVPSATLRPRRAATQSLEVPH